MSPFVPVLMFLALLPGALVAQRLLFRFSEWLQDRSRAGR